MYRRQFLLAAAAAFTTIAAAGPTLAQQRLDLRFATSAAGGTGYMYAVAVATVVGERKPNIKITPFPTAGVVENDRLLRRDEADLILHTGGFAYDSFNGKGRFKEPYAEMRALFPIYASMLQIVVPKDSPVRSLSDLKGRRVGLAEPGSSANVYMRSIMRIEGVVDGDYQARPNSLTQQASGLVDGNLDSLSIIMGSDAPALKDLAVTRDVRWISIRQEALKKLQAENPPGSVVPAEIAPNTFKGQTEMVKTFGVPIWVMASAKLDGSAVEAIVSTFFQNLGAAQKIHPVVKETTKSFLEGATPPVPWHPAAKRALEAQGFKVQEAG